MSFHSILFRRCSVDGGCRLHTVPTAVPQTDVPETAQRTQVQHLPVLLLSARAVISDKLCPLTHTHTISFPKGFCTFHGSSQLSVVTDLTKSRPIAAGFQRVLPPYRAHPVCYNSIQWQRYIRLHLHDLHHHLRPGKRGNGSDVSLGMLCPDEHKNDAVIPTSH